MKIPFILVPNCSGKAAAVLPNGLQVIADTMDKIESFLTIQSRKPKSPTK